MCALKLLPQPCNKPLCKPGLIAYRWKTSTRRSMWHAGNALDEGSCWIQMSWSPVCSLPSVPQEILSRLITTGTVRVCYDARILCEYRQVLLRPAVPVQPSPGRIRAGSTRSRWRPCDSGPSSRESARPGRRGFSRRGSRESSPLSGDRKSQTLPRFAPPRGAGRFPKKFPGVVPKNGWIRRFMISHYT